MLENSPKALVLLAVLFFIIAFATPAPKPLKRTDYIAPPPITTHLTAGLNSQTADTFWLRAIQDMDFCDQPINSRECQGKSWLYHIVNTVTNLDKKFIEAYYFGALALTVIISDYEGATLIFDKGVTEFPNDWQLAYAAGYHALMEEKNKSKASKLYFAAAKNGAPAWVQSMAGKLAAEGGEGDYAEQILQYMISTNQDEKLVVRLKEKLAEVQNKKVHKK